MRHNGGTNPVRKRSPPYMCRPQPGPRCPKHSSARIASHLATRKRIQDRLARAKPNTLGYERAAQDLADIDDTLLMDHTDLNSAPSRWDELSAEIDGRFAEDPDDPDLPRYARALATGRLMHAERTRQAKMMPTIDRDSASDAASAAWSALGEARADMARFKVRMDMNGSDYDTWSKWRDRHKDAATRAEVAAARYETVTANGPSAWRDLDADEKLAARAAVAKTADFTTPTAPQTLGEVFNEYADRAEGKPPLVSPELANSLGPDSPGSDIDSTAWAEERARQAASASGAPAPSAAGPTLAPSSPSQPAQAPAEEAADAQGGRSGKPQRKTPPGYAGQRANRRRRLASSKQVWMAIKRAERSLDGEGLRRYIQPAQGQGKDPDAASVLDPTGITFLLSMMSPGKR